VKLPLQEAEHDALLAELARWDGYVSSGLLGAEAIRACARYGPEYARLAREWLEGLSLLPIDEEILGDSLPLRPPELRSLDVLHLATALSVGDELGVLITYDQRLAAAAEAHGLSVVQPV